MPPKPLEFPLKFKVFLRHAIGGRLYGDRLHIFRRFWCDRIKRFSKLKTPKTQVIEIFSDTGMSQESDPREFTDEGRLEMANEIISIFIEVKISEHTFKSLVKEIKEWREGNRHQQRINAAKSSWSETARRKRKKKKSLAQSKNLKK
jgi:hypothetical protein